LSVRSLFSFVLVAVVRVVLPVVRCGLARCCWPTRVRACRDYPFVLQPPSARSLAIVVATMGGVDRASLTIDGPRAVAITLGSCYPGAFVRRCVITKFVFAGVLPLSSPNSSTWFCYSLVIFPSASSSPPSHPVIHSFRFACFIINLLPSHPVNPICRSFIVEHNQRIDHLTASSSFAAANPLVWSPSRIAAASRATPSLVVRCSNFSQH